MKALRIIAVTTVYAVCFLAVIDWPVLHTSAATVRGFMFRTLVEVGFVAWVTLAWSDQAYRPRRSWILSSLVGLVGIMAVSSCLAIDPVSSFWGTYGRMEGWATWTHLLAFFLTATAVLSTEQAWLRLFNLSLGVNLAVIVHGCLQMSGFAPTASGLRIAAAFGNPSYLAGYALCHAFLAVAILRRTQAVSGTCVALLLSLGFSGGLLLALPRIVDWHLATWDPTAAVAAVAVAWLAVNAMLYAGARAQRLSLVYWLIAAGNIALIYGTATRGAILGLIVGVLTALVLAAFVTRNLWMRVAAVTAIIFALLGGTGVFLLRDSPVTRNNPVLRRIVVTSAREASTGARLGVWGSALAGFRDRPLLGWGFEHFHQIHFRRPPTEFHVFAMSAEGIFDRAHSFLLEWLIAGGCLGLTTYLAVIAAITVSIWQAGTRLGSWEKCLLTGMLAGWFAHQLFLFDTLATSLVIILVGGYLHYLRHGHAMPAAGARASRAAAVAALAALLAFAWFVTVPQVLACRQLKLAIDAPFVGTQTSHFRKALSYGTFGDLEIRSMLSLKALEGPPDGELLPLAREQWRIQLARTPLDGRVHAWAGQLAFKAGDYDEAAERYLGAHSLAPHNPEVMAWISEVCIARRDYASAVQWSRQAVDSINTEPMRLRYARAAIYAGDMPTAERLLAETPADKWAYAGRPATLAFARVLEACFSTHQYCLLAKLCRDRAGVMPQFQYRMSAAAACMLAEERENAIAEIESALEIEPEFQSVAESLIREIQAGRNPLQWKG